MYLYALSLAFFQATPWQLKGVHGILQPVLKLAHLLYKTVSHD